MAHVRERFTPARGGAKSQGFAWAAVVALCCAAGCLTEFEPGSDTPSEGVESNGAPLEPGGADWSCIAGGATVPRPPPTNSEQAAAATYSVTITDFVTGRPVSGVQARACARVDIDCAMPLLANLTTSADGALRVRLFEGFDGFLEVVAEGMVPALLFLGGPLQGDTQGFPAYLVPLSAAGALADAIGFPIDVQFGLIGFWTLDCVGLPAGGVLVSNDAGGQIYNFVAGLPAFQTSTADGIGGFINVPPGRVLIRGVLANGGQTMGVQSLLVRPGWISVSNLQPGL